MYETDTIAAISTPFGEGGIGIVRLSGKEAIEIADKVFSSPRGKSLAGAKSHKILYGHIIEPGNGTAVDEVLVSVMRSPHTYTREDTVEINCHGGSLPLRRVLELVLKCGARLAMPGEFTQRAFMNGRIDLVQAEAVLDIIRSKSDEGKRAALTQLEGSLSAEIGSARDHVSGICAQVEAYIDFPEEEIERHTEEQIVASIRRVREGLARLVRTYEESRLFRDGVAVAIVGRPNVGKSSLLNALLDRERAIVTEVPGTTRDTLEEFLNIDGLPVRITDTAGIRQCHDLPEREGVRRSLMAIEQSDLVLALFDGSREVSGEDLEVIERVGGRKAIFVVNKSDLPRRLDPGIFAGRDAVGISARTGEGIELLRSEILRRTLTRSTESREGALVTNLRHKVLIAESLRALEESLSTMTGGGPLEIAAVGLRSALDSLGEIVGAVTTDDILNRIFRDFCIGK